MEPVFLLQLIKVSVISFSCSAVLVTRKVNLTVRALLGWTLFLSTSTMLGAAAGVSLPLIEERIQAVLFQGSTDALSIPLYSYPPYQGYSFSAGLLLHVICVKFLPEDLSSAPGDSVGVSSLALTPLGSLFLLLIIYLDDINS